MADGSVDRLLVTLNVAVDAFAICEVRRGLRLIHPKSDAIEVHYVLSGTMHLTVPGAEPLVCRPGSVVVVPPGLIQAMTADGCSGRDINAADNCSMTGDGLLLLDAADGGAGDLRVVCGSIMANFAGSFGLLDKVTEPLAEDLSQVKLVRQAFATMLQEIARPTLGTRALIGALMKTCLVMSLRRYFDGSKPHSTLLAHLRDPRLGKAVLAVLDRPAAPHTVAMLASAAGMSRSAFAREFAASFALTPMEFVTKIRLHHAAELLRSTAVSVKAIAAGIGFASRSHFSRVFRDAYGTDPRNFRRKASPERDAPTA
ncbi:MAG: helix-turn-helix domain-containing protein [Pseudolabrys sp.]